MQIPSLLDSADAMLACYDNNARCDFTTMNGHGRLTKIVINDIPVYVLPGTETIGDVLLSDIVGIPVLIPGYERLGLMHDSFGHEAAGIAEWIDTDIEAHGLHEFGVIGHSAGASRAIAAAAMLMSRGYEPLFVHAFEPAPVVTSRVADTLDCVTWTQTGRRVGTLLETDAVTHAELWNFGMPRRCVQLVVPETLDAVDSHRMVGVLAGLRAAEVVDAGVL